LSFHPSIQVFALFAMAAGGGHQYIGRPRPSFPRHNFKKAINPALSKCHLKNWKIREPFTINSIFKATIHQPRWQRNNKNDKAGISTLSLK